MRTSHTKLDIEVSDYEGRRQFIGASEAFTEHAQTQDAETQIYMEEDAGHLTSWISKNKEVLLN